jgi:hypothetical protein
MNINPTPVNATATELSQNKLKQDMKEYKKNKVICIQDMIDVSDDSKSNDNSSSEQPKSTRDLINSSRENKSGQFMMFAKTRQKEKDDNKKHNNEILISEDTQINENLRPRTSQIKNGEFDYKKATNPKVEKNRCATTFEKSRNLTPFGNRPNGGSVESYPLHKGFVAPNPDFITKALTVFDSNHNPADLKNSKIDINSFKSRKVQNSRNRPDLTSKTPNEIHTHPFISESSKDSRNKKHNSLESSMESSFAFKKMSRTVFKPQEKTQMLSDIYDHEMIYKKKAKISNKKNHRIASKSPGITGNFTSKMAINSASNKLVHKAQKKIKTKGYKNGTFNNTTGKSSHPKPCS